MATDDRDKLADALARLADGEHREDLPMSSGSAHLAAQSQSIQSDPAPSQPAPAQSGSSKPSKSQPVVDPAGGRASGDRAVEPSVPPKPRPAAPRGVRPPMPGGVKPKLKPSSAPAPVLKPKERPAAPIPPAAPRSRPAAPAAVERTIAPTQGPHAQGGTAPGTSAANSPDLELSSALHHVVEDSDDVIAPAPDASVLARTRPQRLRSSPLMKSLQLKRTMIPTLLVLGVTLPLLAGAWFALDEDSLIRTAGLKLPLTLLGIGILLLVAGVLNVLAVRDAMGRALTDSSQNP